MIGISQVKGITLIETVIAVSILAVGIVGVLQAFPLGAHLAKTAQMSTIATELGQAKIEQELSRSYNSIPVSDTVEDYGSMPGKRLRDEALHVFIGEKNINLISLMVKR